MKECYRVCVSAIAVEGCDQGVAGEHGGADGGEYSLAGDGGGRVEVEGADERLHAVVEVEPWSNQGGGGVGLAGIRRGARKIGVAAEGVERGFDAEAALSASALGSGFLGGGEGVGASWEENGGERRGAAEGAEEDAGQRHGG